eukprot:TRINITY_DN9010_c0_g1_i1.p1 TRINITY_DN9010_c0_g1~~TRINITY_DN9010_c0_g1_i1.p1  ORF type:complete len:493 (-),score=112.06 TRINITY_DN9010_c0_g1_i1:9-1487(-)
MRMAQRLLSPPLTTANLNPSLLAAEYAVRGEVVTRGMAIEKALATNPGQYPFTDLIRCNIGNPQQLGLKPITFNRQVLSLFANPDLLTDARIIAAYPADVIERAKEIIQHTTSNNGGYSHSKGLAFVREDVAKFLEQRDGCPADPESIFLTDGASPGVKLALYALIRGPQDGILTPIPQYPLYSASITQLNGTQVGYYLDEKSNWGLSIDAIRSALYEARRKSTVPGFEVRALVVINPGNPTGQVLLEENMREIVRFAKAENLVLLADEVYQQNVYKPEKPFVSFKKVVNDMGPGYKDTVQLISFHSVSKGMLGECGLRGGYFEMVNFDSQVMDQFYKAASICLCPNVFGQIMVSLMVQPPTPGAPSYAAWKQEYDAIYSSLQRRAIKLVASLNQLEGVTCNPVEGAMYVFPQIRLPEKAKQAAAERKQAVDLFYCLECLEHSGVVMVPGSGFGQEPGTSHYRATILPPEDQMDQLCASLSKFHSTFMKRYS